VHPHNRPQRKHWLLPLLHIVRCLATVVNKRFLCWLCWPTACTSQYKTKRKVQCVTYYWHIVGNQDTIHKICITAKNNNKNEHCETQCIILHNFKLFYSYFNRTQFGFLNNKLSDVTVLRGYIILQYSIILYVNHVYLMMALYGWNMSWIYMKAWRFNQ
jgi:hypothetical protein